MHLLKRENLRETLILHGESGQSEPCRLVDPLVAAAEAGGGTGRQDFVSLVLVRTLRPDRFARFQFEFEVGGWDSDDLPSRADEMHFHAALPGVPAGAVDEPVELEGAPQFVVDPAQDVAVERGSDL